MGRPQTLDDLPDHRLIDKLHGADLLGWADLLGQPLGALAGRDAAFRCDDFEAMRLAARAGLGLALVPDWVVGDDVRCGALSRLRLADEAWNARPVGIWLLRALAQPSARLRIVTAALRQTIGNPPIWHAE